MKKMLFALTLLLGAALAVLPARSQVPGQPGKGLPLDLGPGDKGAVLRQPWLEPPGAPSAPAVTPQPGAAPSYLQNLLPELGRSEERRVGKECRSRWSRYH